MVSHNGCVNMAYSVNTKVCTPDDVSTTLKALLDDSSLTTLHGIGITHITNALVLCWIAYE